MACRGDTVTDVSIIARLRIAVALVATVVIVGTIGYRLFGLGWGDALYMTVITVTTVGYRELLEPTGWNSLFTVVIIVTGVSTVLYTFTLTVQAVVEGQLREFVGRRRMDRRIEGFRGHTVICGWGRVGRAVADDLRRAGHQVAVVDSNDDLLRDLDMPVICGDATADSTLRAAGVEHARALVAAIDADAENLMVTLSARTINPNLFIVARARADESIAKLTRAGADRVVNPQELGAARMATFVVQPNVAEFIDVVMHERSVEFRMRELVVPASASGLHVGDVRSRGNVVVLAVRGRDGEFITDPDGDMELHPGQIVIAVGADDACDHLEEVLA